MGAVPLRPGPGVNCNGLDHPLFSPISLNGNACIEMQTDTLASVSYHTSAPNAHPQETDTTRETPRNAAHHITTTTESSTISEISPRNKLANTETAPKTTLQ